MLTHHYRIYETRRRSATAETGAISINLMDYYVVRAGGLFVMTMANCRVILQKDGFTREDLAATGTEPIIDFRPFEAESSRFNYGISMYLFCPVLSLKA